MINSIADLFRRKRKEEQPFVQDDLLVTKYRPDQCGNCHNRLEKGDLYCRVCGTRRGEGKFEPYQNIMQCIYGPAPIERTHVCERCGYTWTTVLMLDKEKHCPKCGSSAPYTENVSFESPWRLQEKDIDSDIKAIKARHCSSCNQLIEEGLNFCAACGAKAPDSGELVDFDKDWEATVGFCPYCSGSVAFGSVYCPHCGRKLWQP